MSSEKPSYREGLLLSENGYDECDRIDLRTLGHLQAQSGNAIFISFPLNKVIAVDEDILTVPFIKHADEERAKNLVGAQLSDIIAGQVLRYFFDGIEMMVKTRTERNFTTFSYEENIYAATFSTTTSDFSIVGIEIEHVDSIEASGTFHSTLNYVASFIDSEMTEHHHEIASMACDVLFNILGSYDRGMVYCFNDDLSGEVIHEIKVHDIESSYVGHRFPAGDIPHNARQLYKKNILRYIQDSGAQADVPIVSSQQIDLTQIRSRACHPIHLIYLQNMGVVSSMSLAIIAGSELWGLLTFHGYKKAFKPSLHERIACETIASIVSARVDAMENRIQNSRIIRLGETLMNLRKTDKITAENIKKTGKKIIEICDADVLVAKVENVATHKVETVVVGDDSLVPAERFWSVLSAYPNREVCFRCTRKGIQELGLEEEDCPAAGFAYFHEGQTQVMLGRGWRTYNVKWCGNPDEPKLRINNLVSPRKSFETFLEKAKTECKVWSPADQSVFGILRDQICSDRAHNWMMTLLKADIEEANLRYFNAIERSEMNNAYFAHMCHELRTPFHGVLGCLNIIQESLSELSEGEVQGLVETALSSGSHMINLLNDILAKSKNQYMASSAAFEDHVVFQQLATEAVKGMSSLAINMHISFRFDVTPEDPVAIVTDKTKVIQITTNIINNAIKFAGSQGCVGTRFRLVDSYRESLEELERNAMSYEGFVCSVKEGEMTESLSVVKELEFSDPDLVGSKWMCLSVSDTGPGMGPDELALMFKPYTQGRLKNSNRAFQGTGLGLYICVSLCHQLRGYIACCSTLEVGTVFHVGIPVGLSHHDTEGLLHESDKDLSQEAIYVSGPLLIVDDNSVNLKILERQLLLEFRKVGLDVEIVLAESGEEAVDLYKRRLPSVLIVDYHMPGIDGVECTKAIRTYESVCDLEASYILSYTADTTEDAERLLFKSGADQIMSKPPVKGFLSKLVSRFRISNGRKALEL
jgi:light-regulated signal transduction histidine kinase (bacteriophytochrome)/CheY-like chemotaxis protein